MKNFLNIARKRKEAGSIVLRVGNDMDEKELTDIVSGSVCLEDEVVMENKREEVNGAAAAKNTLETNDGATKEDVEIRRLIGERSTSKGKKQRLKDLSNQILKCVGDKKKAKRQEEIQRILENFKGIRNIPGIKSANGRVLITKIKK